MAAFLSFKAEKITNTSTLSIVILTLWLLLILGSNDFEYTVYTHNLGEPCCIWNNSQLARAISKLPDILFSQSQSGVEYHFQGTPMYQSRVRGL
jgi:hypothetical protein